jgi:type III secretion system chaperone SycN
MSWVDDALADFGRSLGIDGLRFQPDRPVQLEFARLGTLYFEPLDGQVLSYLVRRLDRADAGTLATALELCHWEHHHAFPVQAGLHDDSDLSFAVRIPESDFTLPTIERVVDLLGKLQDAATEGATA